MADVREDAMRRGGELDVNLNISGGADKGITGNNAGSFGGKQQKTLTEQLKKMAGIDIGIGALLKQSQIFTGFLGNLFAIVGALIDTVLAPLAPMAFKALGHLGKIIPKIAAMAAVWIPKIALFIEDVVTKIDQFFKKWWDKDYAGKILKGLLILIGINLAMKTIMMTGRMAGSVMGLRSGGALNMAGRGIGGVGRIGGSLATRGIGGSIAAAGTALMGTRALRGFRGGGGGGGGAGAAAAVSTAGGGGGTPAGWASPYSPTGKHLGNQTKPPATPQGTIKGGIARLGRLGSMRAMGRIPIIGGVVAVVTGYSEGREQGMSQGKSAGRGGFSAAGAIGGGIAGAKVGALTGAAIGGVFGAGVGAVPGAAIGGFVGGAAGMIGGGMAGGSIFDALFGKGPKAGGGGGGRGPYNLDVTGQQGAAGYRAPLFVAEAAEFWSEQVRKDGAVLDDHTIEVELSKRKIAEEAAAREKGAKDWEEYLAHIIKVGTHTGLTSVEKDSMDDPDDIGTGGATIAGGLFRNPEVIAAEKAAKEAAAVQKAAEEAEAIRKNNEFIAEQKRLNDIMIQEDQEYSDRIELEERLRRQAIKDAEAAELAKQFEANETLKKSIEAGTTASTELLSGEGFYADAIRNDPSALNILLQTDSTDSTEQIFVARTIGNKTYQTQVYSGEDPWR